MQINHIKIIKPPKNLEIIFSSCISIHPSVVDRIEKLAYIFLSIITDISFRLDLHYSLLAFQISCLQALVYSLGLKTAAWKTCANKRLQKMERNANHRQGHRAARGHFVQPLQMQIQAQAQEQGLAQEIQQLVQVEEEGELLDR